MCQALQPSPTIHPAWNYIKNNFSAVKNAMIAQK